MGLAGDKENAFDSRGKIEATDTCAKLATEYPLVYMYILSSIFILFTIFSSGISKRR